MQEELEKIKEIFPKLKSEMIEQKIIFKKEISQSENPEKTLEEKINEYNKKFATPYRAAHRGYVDEVIMPHQSREKLIFAFEMLENKVATLPKKKHGNIPL
jgi:propionyl-CoA carboxylase beta chain